MGYYQRIWLNIHRFFNRPPNSTLQAPSRKWILTMQPLLATPSNGLAWQLLGNWVTCSKSSGLSFVDKSSILFIALAIRQWNHICVVVAGLEREWPIGSVISNDHCYLIWFPGLHRDMVRPQWKSDSQTQRAFTGEVHWHPLLWSAGNKDASGSLSLPGENRPKARGASWVVFVAAFLDCRTISPFQIVKYGTQSWSTEDLCKHTILAQQR